MFDLHIDYPKRNEGFDYKLVAVIKGPIRNGDLDKNGIILWDRVKNTVMHVNTHILLSILCGRVYKEQRGNHINWPDGSEAPTLYREYINQLEEDRWEYEEDYKRNVPACRRFKRSDGLDVLTAQPALDILIDTRGGDATESRMYMLMAQSIRLLGGHVRVFAGNRCESGGAHIFMNTSDRFVLPNTKLLIHNPTQIWEGTETLEELQEPQGVVYGLSCFFEKNCKEPDKRETAIDRCLKAVIGSDRDDDYVEIVLTGSELAEFGIATRVSSLLEMKAVWNSDANNPCKLQEHPKIKAFFCES